jgi:hypothetical protein
MLQKQDFKKNQIDLQQSIIENLKNKIENIN